MALKKIAPATYVLPQEAEMRVPGLIIASEELLAETESEKPLDQVRNVAHLPGIVGYSIAMPDMHWGYGFPIGGVAATDAEEGVISPGGVGYDINCGVRLALTPLIYKELSKKQRETLLKTLFQLIPSGIGHGHRGGQDLTEKDYAELLQIGALWSIEKGCGLAADLECMESHGCIEGAEGSLVSSTAKERGRTQLGSIGSGNHFVEIGEVETILLPEIAAAWQIYPGQLYVLIHSGSRGFGHQVCQDYLTRFIKLGYADALPDRQLVAAPLRSPAGKQYFAAMAAAANYAFNNRQQILHAVRQGFKKVLNLDTAEIRLLYDVCHNIAKFEEYEVAGKKRRLCVHRKGATRAYGPKHPELAERFRQSGQPVFVPGDMGRASYVLVGRGNPITWCSCCHGAGRLRSRSHSSKKWAGQKPIQYMQEKREVAVMAHSLRTISEEMPDAYKDVEQVVKAVEEAGLADRVARLRPRLVIKG